MFLVLYLIGLYDYYFRLWQPAVIGTKEILKAKLSLYHIKYVSMFSNKPL